MTSAVENAIRSLDSIFRSMGSVAVAVSGGVDSITLACVAHRSLGADATMLHAVSPAVPPDATERTLRHAAKYGWQLEQIDAGEFSDPDYLSNPVNRCFYCKTSLYSTIAGMTSKIIVSGTNVDDLSDFRPGLRAAAKHRVRHPYVEAEIDKSLVRAIARHLDLGDLATLPASPCLSSRIETGIAVDARTLGMIDAVESFVRRDIAASIVRCRVRREGLVVELDGPSYARLAAGENQSLQPEIEQIGHKHGYQGAVSFEPYRMGSAFLRA